MKIEKGIPIPPKRKSKDLPVFPFMEMEVGDSFFVANNDKREKQHELIRNCITRFLQGYEAGKEIKFTVRTIQENDSNGVRVWRIK